MVNLSDKELSSISDSLAEEEFLVKKYQMLASQATDAEIKDKFNEVSMRHQEHFNDLYSLLS